MSDTNKETIYIDVDDEITGIIDKVRAAKHRIVALVLPKRAATLQSIVNMKLLKRTADEAKKSLVLITSEMGLMPLAGAVGLHVAKTLQSKPTIPPPPEKFDSSEAFVQESDESADDSELKLDRSKSIGELAGALAVSDDVEETIEVGDDNETAAAGAIKAKTKKSKKLKVPNFESFRLRLILGIAALIILIVGWVLASVVLPKARITIKTDTSTVNSNLNLSLSTAAKQLDKNQLVVPATLQETKKTDTEKVAATGQKDQGTQATGVVTLRNCTHTDGSVKIPAGTGVSTTEGSVTFTYITQQDVTVPASVFSGGGSCISPTKDVNVTAQKAGGQYNLSKGRTFTVAGFPGVNGTNQDAMSGGTSQIVKVISGADMDTAKQKLKDRSTPTATDELKKALTGQNLFALADTLTVSDPVITSSPNIGDEAAEVTVTQVVTYDMLGVKKDDLKNLVETDAKKQIDTSKQVIVDNGLDKAVFRVADRKSPGEVKVSMQTIVTAGPDLNTDTLKKQIAGKKKGDTVAILQNRPGIKDVNIDYSPFWVFSTPKRASRITIIFEQPPNNANTKP